MIVRDEHIAGLHAGQQGLGLSDTGGAMRFVAFERQEQLGGGPYGIVVLEQHDAAAGRRGSVHRIAVGARRRGGIRPRRRHFRGYALQRNAYAHPRALAQLRGDRHRIAQQARHLAHDGQTEAHSGARRPFAVHLIVFVENSLDLVFRNTDARILDGEDQRVGFCDQRDPYESGLGVLQRVADEILHQLGEQGAIGRYHRLRIRDFQTQFLGGGRGLEFTGKIGQNRGQFDRCDLGSMAPTRAA